MALQAQRALTIARALVSLERLQEAELELARGLEAAQAQNLPYETARLLQTRATLAQSGGGVSAASEASTDAARAQQILSGLGIN